MVSSRDADRVDALQPPCTVIRLPRSLLVISRAARMDCFGARTSLIDAREATDVIRRALACQKKAQGVAKFQQ